MSGFPHDPALARDLAAAIRTIPDHPKPGILFRDVTTLFGDARAFADAVAGLAAPFRGAGITQVVGIEARGFVLGGAVAVALGAGFVPARKPGKLPHRTIRESYALEYGTDTLELHEDALAPGERILVIDDLVATGGTAGAAIALVRRLGAEVAACGFVVDLPELGGADRLRGLGVPVHALVAFEGH